MNNLLRSMINEFKEANLWRKFILIIEYIIVIISKPIVDLVAYITGMIFVRTNTSNEKIEELAYVMSKTCPIVWILKFLDFISVF